MDDGDFVVSTLEQQQEEFRHIQSLSQRFLQVLIALLAVGFVFAKPEWIDFFSGSDVPQTNLTYVCASGGRIMGLQELIVAYNGFILHCLLLISLLSISVGGFWAAQIQFISPPLYLPALGYSQININVGRLRRANRLFKMAHYSVGFGILFIIFTAAGYILFYQIGNESILLFDAFILAFLIFIVVQLIRYLRNEDKREKIIYEANQAGWVTICASLAASFLIGLVLAFAVMPLAFWMSLC